MGVLLTKFGRSSGQAPDLRTVASSRQARRQAPPPAGVKGRLLTCPPARPFCLLPLHTGSVGSHLQQLWCVEFKGRDADRCAGHKLPPHTEQAGDAAARARPAPARLHLVALPRRAPRGVQARCRHACRHAQGVGRAEERGAPRGRARPDEVSTRCGVRERVEDCGPGRGACGASAAGEASEPSS